MGGADWTSPKVALPDEGRQVEMSILPASMDVSRGKRLGETWWIERNIGGSIRMEMPSSPAYWRYPRGSAEGRS